MKIFGRHYYIISSPRVIAKEKRRAMACGLAHVHDNPIHRTYTDDVNAESKGGDTRGQDNQEVGKEEVLCAGQGNAGHAGR